MDNIMERVTLGANFLQQPTWKKAVGIPPNLSPIDNNNTLCAARGVAGQNPSEMRWGYEHPVLLGFRPCLGLAPLPLRKPDRLFYWRRLVQFASLPILLDF
jgi:hypothetical protein